VKVNTSDEISFTESKRCDSVNRERKRLVLIRMRHVQRAGHFPMFVFPSSEIDARVLCLLKFICEVESMPLTSPERSGTT
jgi:hypothetical protein